ncbi:MAG: hypothetical protein V4662_16545 [Verrucomicrobiota bacterium]
MLSRILPRLVASSLLAFGSLTSCVSVDHLAPTYQGPVATIDQKVIVDSEKRNCGFVLAVDDKRYAFSDVSKLKDVFNVEPGRHRLLLRGHVVYLMELRNFSPSPHSQGWVDVTLQPAHRYRVQTRTDAAGTSVWLVDETSGHPASPVIAPGTHEP